MQYTIGELESDIAKINTRLAVIRADRGKRYGSEEDTLANVRDADWFERDGWRGALNGAIECINRLKVMARKKTGDVEIHDFENATDDLINFSYYIKIEERQKRCSIPTSCDNGDCD